MAASLPTFPRVIFTIIEPISLLSGFAGALYDAPWFVAEQIPQKVLVPVTENSVVLAWQLGNMYLLMCLVGLSVLMTTSEIRVVKSYLVALWLGDVGHVAITCYGLGLDRLMDPSGWNAMAGGNIVFTVFLLVTRSLYLMGAFGPDKPAAITTAKKRS